MGTWMDTNYAHMLGPIPDHTERLLRSYLIPIKLVFLHHLHQSIPRERARRHQLRDLFFHTPGNKYARAFQVQVVTVVIRPHVNVNAQGDN